MTKSWFEHVIHLLLYWNHKHEFFEPIYSGDMEELEEVFGWKPEEFGALGVVDIHQRIANYIKSLNLDNMIWEDK